MPFIWRNKHAIPRDISVHPEALACLDAGYILLAGARKEEILSPQLHLIAGVSAPFSGFAALLAALKPESATRLQQMAEALKQRLVTPPLQLITVDGTHTLLARAAVTPSHENENEDTLPPYGIIWLYDISAEARQHARLSQENEKLKSEIKHYSTILNMAPYPIWQRDGDLKIRYYNLAYSEIAEEPDREDEAPEMDRKVKSVAEQAWAAGDAKTERLHIVAGGERKYYQISELPLKSENKLVGFAQDITEFEAVQEELQRYISAQGDLLESSASAMAIYGADMRLRSFNYAFVALWKLDEAWLESNPSYGEILEALREKRKLPEQANFVQFKQQQLKLFTELLAPHEEFFYLPDGRTLRVIAIPHALGGILFAYEDVTDRLALESSYNTLIAVQRETIDHLHEGIALFGEDGRLKLSNPIYLAIWGLAPKLAAGAPHIADIVDRVRHLYHYDNWESFRTTRIAQIQKRSFDRVRLERTDGKVIDCTTVPLPDGATLITYLDVTDTTLVERSLRERNEALTETDRLKSEFLANVSYELRSPLTSISGFSEMLRQEYFGGLTEKQKEYVEGIHHSSQHLMQLVNDILDLASIEAGYMQLEVTHFDIAAMLHSVLPLVQERLKQHDLTLIAECREDIGEMLGDETRIRQILFKLLSNAIKFSLPGRSITVGAKEHEAGSVMLWVADNGYGIPQEEQEAIFEKFHKARNPELPRSVSRSGAGLGLSTVKSFVELHGGRIELTSEPGKGTYIRCILPRENPSLLQYQQPGQKPARKKRAGE